MNIMDKKNQSKSNYLCAQKPDLKLMNTLLHVLVCINVCAFTSLTTVHLCIRKSVLLTPCSKTRFGNFLMAKSRSLHCSRVLLIFWATLSNIWHCVGVETAANISKSKTRVRKPIKKIIVVVNTLLITILWLQSDNWVGTPLYKKLVVTNLLKSFCGYWQTFLSEEFPKFLVFPPIVEAHLETIQTLIQRNRAHVKKILHINLKQNTKNTSNHKQ